VFATLFGWTVSAWLLYLAGLAAFSILIGISDSTRHRSRTVRYAWLTLFALPVAVALAVFLILVWQPPIDGIPEF